MNNIKKISIYLHVDSLPVDLDEDITDRIKDLKESFRDYNFELWYTDLEKIQKGQLK